jgi:general secretion pathway protein G
MQSLEMYYMDQGEYPGQGTKGDLTTISSDLAELNIKNDAVDYSYQTDADTEAEKYIIIYEAASDEFYYISTETSSLTGPETTEPTL